MTTEDNNVNDNLETETPVSSGTSVSDQATAAPASSAARPGSEAAGGSTSATGNGAGPQGANQDDDDEDEDEDAEVTFDDVVKAVLTTPAGRALVTRYREQQLAKLNRSIGFCAVEGKGVIVRVGRNGIGELGTQFNSPDTERMRLANRTVPYVSGEKEPSLKWKPIFPE